MGSASGALALLALLSVMVDSGSIRIMAFFAFIAGTSLYLANDAREEGLNIYDLPPTINKAIEDYI